MKVVICANGKASRWNNYLGVKKHMIEIDGEPLLHRTVRLLQGHNVETIIISSSDTSYEVNGATRIVPKRNTWLIDQYPIECLTEPVLFLLGDVYWTENALEEVLAIEPEKYAFIRTMSPINNWEEEIAVKVVDFEGFKAGIKAYRNDLFRGLANDIGGPELRVKMLGIPYSEARKNHDLVVNITPDETTDFDWPEDYDKWIEKFRNSEQG